MEALILAQQREIERLRNLLDQSVYVTDQGIVVRDRHFVTRVLELFRPNDNYQCGRSRFADRPAEKYLSFYWILDNGAANSINIIRHAIDKTDCQIDLFGQRVHCTHETFLIRLVEIENAIKEYFMRDEKDFSKMFSVLDEFLMHARADWRKRQAK